MRLESLLVLHSHSANKYGDLFASSMSSLFSILGYQDFRFNIHKTGREIDIEGSHSTEVRRLIAECKATAEPIGGREINTFMGKVEVERQKDPTPLQPYFISLNGFTEPAVEQEKEAGKRVVLLDGAKVIANLVKGEILIDKAKAAELSGRLVATDAAISLHQSCYLVVSDFGNIWLFFYLVNNEKVSFSLVHGDGTFISAKLASEISRDIEFKRLVDGLKYIAPKSPPDLPNLSSAVRKKYTSYLAKVCGEIPLDGLPADQ